MLTVQICGEGQSYNEEQINEGLRRAYYAPFSPRSMWEDYEPKFEMLDAWEGNEDRTVHLVRLVSNSRYYIVYGRLIESYGARFEGLKRIEDAIR